MVKRKSMGTTEETAFSSSSSSSSTKLSSPTTTTSTSTSSKTSNNRSATKGTVTDTLNDASILPIKVRRIELIEELKDAWNSSVVKANKGRPKDQITVLQTVLPVLHKQLFTSLRKHLVQDDELEIEPVDRDLARRVEKLEKEANKWGAQVMEAREKNRQVLPETTKVNYTNRLKQFTTTIDVPSSSSSSFSSGSKTPSTPSTTSSSSRKGNKAVSTGKKNKNVTTLTPNITSSTADWKEQISIIRDQLQDAHDTIKEMKPEIMSSTENAEHALQVMKLGGGGGGKKKTTKMTKTNKKGK